MSDYHSKSWKSHFPDNNTSKPQNLTPFEVVQCRNSKLTVGDTFRCPTLIQGLPLVLNQLVHNQQPPCSYVCGKQGGITFNRIE